MDVLVAELNDLAAVVELLQAAGVDLPGLHDRGAIEAKKDKVRKFMGYAKERGAISDHPPV